MIKIKFVDSTDSEHLVEASPDVSLMEVAVENDIEGIEAICSGVCSCATCHVSLEQSMFDKLSPPSENELELLEYAENRTSTSRLSCQIKVSELRDGATVAVVSEY